MDRHGEPIDPSVSRRTVLAGLGGVAGAAAVGAWPTDLADAAPVAGGPSLVATPGLRYRVWSQVAFVPATPVTSRAITGSGAYPSGVDGELAADVDLEAGSVITEVTAAMTNASGGETGLYVVRMPLAGGQFSVVQGVPIPTGSPAVQKATVTGSHVVDGEAAYAATAFCRADGSIRVFGLRLGYVPVGYGLVPVAPTRVYDSRPGNPPLNVVKGPLANGTRLVNLLLGVSLPVKPKGVLVNLTVVNTSPTGFLAMYRAGTAWAGTSSINWSSAGEIVANTTYTDVDVAGQVEVRVPPSSSTDFFVDLVGYYL